MNNDMFDNLTAFNFCRILTLYIISEIQNKHCRDRKPKKTKLKFRSMLWI